MSKLFSKWSKPFYIPSARCECYSCFTSLSIFSIVSLFHCSHSGRASLIAQLVKNPPAMQETPIWFLGQENPLEKGKATHSSTLGLPLCSAGKESTCNAGDLGWISKLGRSPGGGKGYPFQYSGLENSMDCIVHGIAKSRTTEWVSLSLSFW